MKILDLIHGDNPTETMIDFIKCACHELDLQSIPKIKIIGSHVHNEHSNSFASYVPGKQEINLMVKNRHILDVLRSLAHEMVHFKQDITGNLPPGAGKTGSDQENEANAVAGKIMREYSKNNPNLFS